MLALLRLLKRTVLRLHDAIVGPNLAVYRRLVKQDRVEFGPHTYGIPIIMHYDHVKPRLIVGPYSALSETALVMLGGEHAYRDVTTYPVRIHYGMEGAGADGNPMPVGDTHIGADVWLTQRTFVRSGVTIGDGAIIASGAVITKDVPPYAIVGGNPGRVLRYRFEPHQIEELLRIRWWDWPDEEVKAAAPYLVNPDVDRFIAYARERFPDHDGTPRPSAAGGVEQAAG